MKYNPRVNELVARIEGLAEAHPYRPDGRAQGMLEIIALLQHCLIEITGMDAITLQPAAGAHGEFTGILLVRAWHESQGNARRKILIPDSAHGTNPATAAICGYQVENLKSTPRPSEFSKVRFTKSPTSCTPKAHCSTWMAPT
jgi:glycine dehydrogenase subunit 2